MNEALTNAKWIDLTGFTKYEITDLGFVRNKITGRILRPSTAGKGYYLVKFCEKGIVSRQYLHRLLAIHFVANPENKAHVNHINGVMKDNRIENLEWATPQENIQHAHTIGLCPRENKVRAGKAKQGFRKLISQP